MMLSMTKQAQKALSDLDAKQYRQVGSLIFGLLSNPQPHDSQPLQGAPRGDRRVDAGAALALARQAYRACSPPPSVR